MQLKKGMQARGYTCGIVALTENQKEILVLVNESNWKGISHIELVERTGNDEISILENLRELKELNLIFVKVEQMIHRFYPMEVA